jgi:hypothetical protein
MPLTEIINKENIISDVENINISGKVCIICKLFENLGYVMSIELQVKFIASSQPLSVENLSHNFFCADKDIS